MHLSFTVFALIQFDIPTEDGCFSHNFLDVSLDVPSRSGEADVRVKGPCKMQPGHYFFIDGRDEEWPEVWWCDQICHIHEKVWGRNLFFQSTKGDSSRHSRRFCEHLRSFRCLCKEVVSVADWVCVSFFFAKEKHGGISILTKKDETVSRISELEKKLGVFFFFSQLFLMAQTLLLAVQLGGPGIFGVSQLLDRGTRSWSEDSLANATRGWRTTCVLDSREVGCFWTFTNQLGWFNTR